ncbi:flagellar basal-body rod protein FlgF [Hoeflea marina]|uniref:Flagellar basal-body rod protein FlgF n=1 Tax=Hoeflea marina TaxID=274592 RepID=A0A317PJ81_9HYPH|nr:flagellar basal-body rod protein FlgF [Hoeflea marina]PWV99817.1 flagellar basal-body rod protein FlgF [Hoeflea marina]
MQGAINVVLSSQLALERRLTTIADNVANANTTGFRATEIKFDEVLANAGDTRVSFVDEGTDFLSNENGGLRNTGSEFDFAVRGDAWFQIESPTGPVLTRDGRFTMTQTGELVNIDGYPVLDPGGAPIQLDPAAGAPFAGQDGNLTQNGTPIGAIGLFTADLTQGYARQGSLGVIPTVPAEPAVDRAGVGVVQGYLEESNVNPVAEMSRLIMVSRAFENASASMRSTEDTLREAIKTLGSGR